MTRKQTLSESDHLAQLREADERERLENRRQRTPGFLETVLEMLLTDKHLKNP